MKRVAIVGGGIAGLAAAYELEQQRCAGKLLDWQLYEATNRLGGIVQTTRHATPEGEYILEGGPDAWVTEKPWARELAEELGLRDEIITSRDADKKTYLWFDGKLVAMPDRMRMMVPEDLATLETSPLFSFEAKQAYARELERADELKHSIPDQDESVASFVHRHFGEEVLEKVAAPLLSGVFGGDVRKLSVRAVMPAFVKMEAEHGSLIAALQARAGERGATLPKPTFTSLRRGMGSLVEALFAALPQDRLHLHRAVAALDRVPDGRWQVSTGIAVGTNIVCDDVLLAAPVDAARSLLQRFNGAAANLLPADASSAVLACFCWRPEQARTFCVPPGFGFLIPKTHTFGAGVEAEPRLLAGTFTDQKFPFRAPSGARSVRVFFGGAVADQMNAQPDQAIAARALRELRLVLPRIPDPAPELTTIRRWPRSLPQYEVGHLDRMTQLDALVARLPGLHLLGNSYRGVGLPDLIRDARALARAVAAA